MDYSINRNQYYCSVAGTALQQVGHADAYRLDGGISNWKAQGLPLIKAK